MLICWVEMKAEGIAEPTAVPPGVESEGMLSGGTFVQKLEREAMRYLAIKGDPDMIWIGRVLQAKLQEARFNDAKSGDDLDDKQDARNEARRQYWRTLLGGYLAELRSDLDELLTLELP